MILRAKTKTLFQGKELSEKQQANTDLNMDEIDSKKVILESMPRRLVFELTNICNLNCIMCGRNACNFKPTVLEMDWFKWFEPMFDIVEEVTLMGWGEPTMHPNFSDMLQIIDKHSARKYFCTNGMRLDRIMEDIFKYHVDVFAVSVDGTTAETNDKIRRGSDIDKIVRDLTKIVQFKKEHKLTYPWINFVFCAMKSNLHELPKLVRLAGRIGINEVKVVYLTAFDDLLAKEVLYDCEEEVRKVFNEAEKIGNEMGILLKLPYIQGEDIAGEKEHKDCFVTWRDFFLGSDGYIRPCMSTSVQFDRFDMNKSFEEMWNSNSFQRYRTFVNDSQHMDAACKRCYQSSYCNWNKRETFLQLNQNFAPDFQ